MQADTLNIRPDLRAGLHALAEEPHRGETEMLNEALATYRLRDEVRHRPLLQPQDRTRT